MLIKKYLIMDFADWLKTNREESRLSLRALAKAIDNLCSDAFLSQLENRRYKGKKGALMQPDKLIVIALAKVFGANVDRALVLADYPPENAFEIPPEIAAVGFEGLSPDDIKNVAKYMRFLKSEK